MEQTPENARKDALAFITRNKTGIVATVGPDGAPHASTVYYTADQDFNIYFLTTVNSRKFMALQNNPSVAFTISTPDVPQTLQVEGAAMDISTDEEAAKKKQELFAVLSSNPWFYGPLAKLDQSTVVVVWIRPTWVRWADYAFAEQGSDSVLAEIPVS